MQFIPKLKRLTPLNYEFEVPADAHFFHNKYRVRHALVPAFNAFYHRFEQKRDLSPIRDGLRDMDKTDDVFFLVLAPYELVKTRVNDIVQAHRDRLPDQPQSYYLRVEANYLFLGSRTDQGFYYGAQTLAQLIWQVPPTTPVRIPAVEIVDWPDVLLRGFHLDLKKQMHSYKYLTALVKKLGHYKYNCLLVEYEDKFPYQPPLQAIPHQYAWSEQQFADFLELCRFHFLEVIPLVQTFGHVSFILQHDEFKHLREVPDNDWSFCPLNPESLELVEEFVTQVAKTHPRAKYFHIGADEVYQLGSCPECKASVADHSMSKLYIDFINAVARVVKRLDKTPVMWSDYLIKYPEALADLDPDVVVMYWDYGTTQDPETFLNVRGHTPADAIEQTYSAEMRALYEPYYKIPGKPAAVKALPFTRYFQDQGYGVMGAPSVNSDFQLTIPQYTKRLPNCTVHARECHAAESLGVVVTSWPVCGCPYETQWPAILWNAEVLWQVRPAGEAAASPGKQGAWAEFSDAYWTVYQHLPPGKANVRFDLLGELARLTSKAPGIHALQVTDIPVVAEQFDRAIPAVQDNPTTLVALLFGLKGLLLRAQFLAAVSDLETTLAAADETDAPVTPADLAEIETALKAFLDDVVEYYAESKTLYVKTNIVLPGELEALYEEDRYFKKWKESAHKYLALLQDLPGSFDELLLQAYRDAHF